MLRLIWMCCWWSAAHFNSFTSLRASRLIWCNSSSEKPNLYPQFRLARHVDDSKIKFQSSSNDTEWNWIKQNFQWCWPDKPPLKLNKVTVFELHVCRNRHPECVTFVLTIWGKKGIEVKWCEESVSQFPSESAFPGCIHKTRLLEILCPVMLPVIKFGVFETGTDPSDETFAEHGYSGIIRKDL